MLKDLWEARRKEVSTFAKRANTEIDKLDRTASQVMERLLATSTPVLIKAYESEIQRIEEEKLVLVEKSQKPPENLRPF